MHKLEALLAKTDIVLADGAMGTMLQQAGLEGKDMAVLWNVEHPEKVRAVHRAYMDAGSQIVLTNTFTASPFMLARHNLKARTGEVNRSGAKLLRAEVQAAGMDVLVAGDIGPSGEMLAPLGSLSFDDAVVGFTEQAAVLIDGGVDLIWIETMSDLEETRAAVEAVRRVSQDIPIMATMSFDTRGRTMMGVTPEKATRTLASWNVVAAGGNCGNGPDELIAVIQKMRAATPEALLAAKPNAGRPELVNGQTVFRATPEAMAQDALVLRDAGARIIGGCCGTTPAHLRAMAQALRGRSN